MYFYQFDFSLKTSTVHFSFTTDYHGAVFRLQIINLEHHFTAGGLHRRCNERTRADVWFMWYFYL